MARSAKPGSGVPAPLWWAGMIGLCATLLAPLLIVDVPPLLDYPNHLARAFVLASLPHDPVLARFYAAHWSIIPNLALDLVAPPLIAVLPVHVVGRLLIAAALLLPVLGSIAYNTALSKPPEVCAQMHPKQTCAAWTNENQSVGQAAKVCLGGRCWGFGAALVACNGALLCGFLNFEIALGLALLLAAAWLRWREVRPQRAIVLAALGTPVLFACHLMGVAFCGLLIGGAELHRLSQERSLAAAARRAAALGLVFAAPIALYALSSLEALGGDADFLQPAAKLFQLSAPFINYDWTLDMLAAALSVGVPALCLAFGWGRVPGPAAIAAALLLVAFLLAPFAWKGTQALDTRFAIMLGFMLFAGFLPASWPPWFRRVAVAALLTVFAARMGLLITAWAAHRADLADVRAALAPVRPGQAVYVAEASLPEAPSYWAANPRWRLLSNHARADEHLGALALIEHRAYWPFEFDAPSQQPIETRQPYRALAERVGHLPNRVEAAAADVCGFDYVLLMAADAVPPLPPERFRLLVQSGYAALYGITKCAGPS